MTPFLIDSHCHLHFPAYDLDREAVLARMREKRICGITVGTAMSTSASAIVFAEKTDGIWATVGLHPEHLTSNFHDENEGEVERSLDPVRLEQLARSSSKVVGIGETGLDFNRLDETTDPSAARQLQEESFRQHLVVARACDLPVVIHCREALRRLTEIFQEEQTAGRTYRAVIHSFTGTWDEARPLLDLGFYIAVNGIATFPLKKTQGPSTAIARTIEKAPSDRLLVETDAPYLAPAPYRGKRNEPTYVEEVAKFVAQVRGTSLEEIARQTTENAVRFFRLPI